METALFAASTGLGLWLTVIEKALGMRRSGFDPILGADAGGRVDEGIALLTGHSTDSDYLSVHLSSTTRDKLEKALSSGKAVVAGIRPMDEYLRNWSEVAYEE